MDDETQSRGWWEQSCYGRQPMHPLEVRLRDSRVVGRGCDVVGPFWLDGTLHPSGEVVILKQYVGRHQVLYVGKYDGEGTFAGQWRVEGEEGRWLICLGRDTRCGGEPIADIAPR